MLAQFGVATLTTFDELGRSVRVDFPNGSYARTAHGAWRRQLFSPSDTVLDSAYRLLREGRPADDPERAAYEHAASHAGTPTSLYVDARGLVCATVAAGNATSADRHERSIFDGGGQLTASIDARGIAAFLYLRGLRGDVLAVASVDGGPSWTLSDAYDRAARTWGARGHVVARSHDLGDRVTSVHVQGADASTPQWRLDPDAFGWDTIWFGWSVYQPLRGVAGGEYLDEETLAYDDSNFALRPPLHVRPWGHYDPLTATRLQGNEGAAVDTYTAKTPLNELTDAAGPQGLGGFGGDIGGWGDCFDYVDTAQVTDCLGQGYDDGGLPGGGGGGEPFFWPRTEIYADCALSTRNCRNLTTQTASCVVLRCQKSYCRHPFWVGNGCTAATRAITCQALYAYTFQECDGWLPQVRCNPWFPRLPISTLDPICPPTAAGTSMAGSSSNACQ